ncbi:hypothetical protein B0T26DRAFT_677223 [Lasiosphaeria miniovina]|uniref:DUF7791 domain-containing protein n=1 Tax=Lasiosphaeria miniovina TaxID=1954250 RepID=A0AA40DRF2_9PEZI|nr:uncharacterized protein B0T26DRAFT_677223 [Lasiosphaeria miniovina]KAK0712805.1 hypothetical protein B0T26DRAFT_677223 [Lasiosphaeria miniovina]
MKRCPARCVEIASELMVQLDKVKAATPPPTVKDKDKKDKKSGNEHAEDKRPDSAHHPRPHPRRCEVIDARLKSICAGLLESVNPQYSEIAPDAKVVFLHRTVYDWISKPRVWEGIIRHTAGSGFSPNLCMLRSCVLQLKTFDSSGNPREMTVVADALAYARAAEADLNCGFPKLLDQLHVANLSNELSFFKDADLDGDEEDDMVGRTKRIKGGLEAVVYENRLQHWSCGVEVPDIKTSGGSRTFFDLVRGL